MRFSAQVKPVSYLKTCLAEVLKDIADNRQPLLITQHGEASAVLLDVKSYEQILETTALLKILALGQRQVSAGKLEQLADVVDRVKPGFRVS